MENRSYDDFSGCGDIRGVAVAIISDCVEKGFSRGWSGSLTAFEQVRRICAKFNVLYVDDFNGEWRVID